MNHDVMKPIIIASCDRLEKRINNPISKQDFFNSCVQKKLSFIYKRENDDFDSVLHKLEVYVDCDDFEQVKKCVVKLLRLLSKNRKTLLRTLKELD